MKLSKRLKEIEQLVGSGYDHIWDCCCDHGFLGTALLSRHAAPHIHFVDIVHELMVEVENKLQRYFQHPISKWHVHCLDVTTLPLHQFEGKHLVMIAGVGGDLVTKFVDAIHHHYPDLDIDFVLCPVNHQFKLRQKLNQLGFGLKDELLLKDNQRFYEVIYACSLPEEDNEQVSLVGSKIWQATTDEQATITAEYLQKTLNHYIRIQQGHKKDVKQIIEAYQSITL
ncbi:tRNA (adenine(22)-N(1))-methyltransferase TrmK [Vibrio kasasachensis]|uniref:tRNA (adenine(22)-N(1))-methyltransferase n=1 Tax=Vibrio kasasachensis TaxID=2910248 RepID=UPI003D0BAFD2